jgi:hypothetical protein
MDFRVTHFLVAGASQNAASTATLTALTNGTLAVYRATDNSESAAYDTGSALTVPFYFAQGLNRTDAIEKELGVIKSGIINPSKIVSVRKLVGSDDYSRSIKVFGAAGSILTYNGGGTNGASGTNITFTAGTFYFVGQNLYYCLVNSGSSTQITEPSPLNVGDIVTVGSGSVVYLGAIYLSGTTVTNNKLQLALPTSTGVGSLDFESDKEYTFSVRVRSAQANNISPFGITRGYSALASKTYINPATGASSVSNGYVPFSTLFGLVKNFADDTMLASFANVTAVMHYCAAADGTVTDVIYFKNGNIQSAHATQTGISTNFGLTNIPAHLYVRKYTRSVVIDVTKYTTWHEALSSAQVVVTDLLNIHQNTAIVAGKTYTASLIVDAKEQINYNLSYASGVTDPTVFPYKWDNVRLNGFFHEGPYGRAYDWYTTTPPINAGVSTQTPIVFDQTQSGLITAGTVAINTINFADTGATACTQPANYLVGKYTTGTGASKSFINENQFKFPNLLKEEVRHIAHQYQSYSLKYKQQFKSPRYNAMVMDPFQSKIDSNGPYTLFYIEYMPEVDTTYTSTQPMTNMSIIAVPSANSTLVTFIDNQFSSEVVEIAS